MDIFFRTEKLAKQCSSMKELIRVFGKDCGEKIAQRLLELKAAETLNDVSKLPPARCYKLKADRAGQFVVVVKEPRRLVFEPKLSPLPYDKNGELDLTKVRSIRIIDVEDYHG